MGGVGKGCIVLGIIGLAALAWIVITVSNQPVPVKSIYTQPTVSNYLNNPPEFYDPQVAAIGSVAPDFSYPTVGNRVVRLSDYIGERYVIIDFWATWCPPCQRELPELQSFYAERSDLIEVIAITSERADAKMSIQDNVRRKGLQFPVMHDPSGEISNLYPHQGIPFLVLIDIDGVIRGTHSGYTSDTDGLVAEVFGL